MVKKGKFRCIGIDSKGNPCRRIVIEVDTYCNTHEYLLGYTDEQVKQIMDGTHRKQCKRCLHYHFDDTKNCKVCITTECGKVKEKKKKIKKCGWFDRNMNNCRNLPKNNTEYCNKHQYVLKYSKEMKDGAKKCSDCLMVKYCGNFNTCGECRDRKKKPTKHKNDKCLNKICNKDGCKYKPRENGYCGKHQRLEWKIRMESSGKFKVCRNYVRGCKNLLDNNKESEYSRCSSCRNQDKCNTDPVRIFKKSHIKRNIESKLTDEKVRELCSKPCHYCGEMNGRSFNGIDRVDNNGIYELSNVVPCCTMCNFMKQEKTKNKFINSCINIANKFGTDELNVVPPEQYINDVIREARRKCDKFEREFSLTYDDCLEILSKKCYYCANLNIKSDRIGIDRINSNNGYSLDNVLPCCKTCNFIKFTFPLDEFIRKIRLIVHINNNGQQKNKIKIRKCKGLSRIRTGEIIPCNKKTLNNNPYCPKHKYFVNFNDIKNITSCLRCKIFYENMTTTICKKCRHDYPYEFADNSNRCIFTKNKVQCNKNKINNTKYCRYHSHLESYNELELNNLSFCCGCKKDLYKTNRTCDGCKARAVKYRNIRN